MVHSYSGETFSKIDKFQRNYLASIWNKQTAIQIYEYSLNKINNYVM